MAYEPEKSFLRGKCKNILAEYSDVLKEIEAEITADLYRERVTGASAFEYAQKILRKEGAREGMSLFIAKITKYATESAR